MLHLVSLNSVNFKSLKTPFCLYAEKGGYGHEEGQLEGADHDDRVPRDSFHHSFRLGIFDLRYGCISCV